MESKNLVTLHEQVCAGVMAPTVVCASVLPVSAGQLRGRGG